MSPLLEALARHDIRAVIALWRNGYAITSEEAVAMEQALTCRRGPKQKQTTRDKMEHYARIYLQSKEMKAAKISRRKRKEILAREHNLDDRSIESILRLRDPRVRAVLVEWGKLPNNKMAAHFDSGMNYSTDSD